MSARERSLRTLLQGYAEAPDIAVTGVVLDSRQVKPGDLFLACRGLTVHGLHYLHQALRLGAAAVLWEPAPGVEVPDEVPVPLIAVPGLSQRVGAIAARFYGEPSKTLQVVGITGTNGKTSCSQLLAQTLTLSGRKCGVMGTLGYGLYNALGPGTHTTPDAVQIQCWLGAFRDMGASYASMEVSSHALDQDRVAGTRFAVAVFTNLTRDHLDYHGDLAQYAAAKRRLFTTLAPASAVINLDDPLGPSLLKSLPAATRGVAYGLGPLEVPAEVETLYAEQLDLHAGGMTLRLAGSLGEAEVHARLLGRFNAANLLAMLATLRVLGMEWRELAQLAPQLQPVPGRMECLGGDDQPLLVIDYAHTPDALRQALTALRAHCRGRLWCVFGCGGDRDRGKRPEMAEVAEALADAVVLTDDNPRTEDGDTIIADIRAGLQRPEAAHVDRERVRAIGYAVAGATAGDVILVAGKGHEDYQIVGTEKRPYSDRQTAMMLLGGGLPC